LRTASGGNCPAVDDAAGDNQFDLGSGGHRSFDREFGHDAASSFTHSPQTKMSLQEVCATTPESDPQSPIHRRLQRQDVLQVELTYAEDLVLRVRDNGVGIGAAIVDKDKEGSLSAAECRSCLVQSVGFWD